MILINSIDGYTAIFGCNDTNLTALEQSCGVKISPVNGGVEILGRDEDIASAEKAIGHLLRLYHSGEKIDPAKIRYVSELIRSGREDQVDEILGEVVALTVRGRPIKCKTAGQLEYVQSARRNTLTLAIGPAGTGKTYLAIALAANAIRKNEVDRLILTRPAVEAGEKLGFLPGDMSQKVDPYLRPLYDALYEIMGPDSVQRLTERNVLEIAPLAFMRGRTLSNSFIILDEAQNTTTEQMKMFLTRLGEHSRCIVTGDLTQIDLPRGRESGLKEAETILSGIEDIGIIHLSQDDVVRNELVRRIVEAYERRDKGLIQ